MHLLGLRFAPRIRDLKDTKLCILKNNQDYAALHTMIADTLNIYSGLVEIRDSSVEQQRD